MSDTITGHRPPTPWEIKFGEGATHHRDFPLAEWQRADGSFKKWIKADDRLRYYR